MDDNIKDIVDFLDEEIKERSRLIISASNNNLGSSGMSMNMTSSNFKKPRESADLSSKKKPSALNQKVLLEPSEYSRKQLSDHNSLMNDSILSRSNNDVSAGKKLLAIPFSVSGSNSQANLSIKKSPLGQRKHQLSTAVTTPTNAKSGHSTKNGLILVVSKPQQSTPTHPLNNQLNSRPPSPATKAVKLPLISRGGSKEKPQEHPTKKAA